MEKINLKLSEEKCLSKDTSENNTKEGCLLSFEISFSTFETTRKTRSSFGYGTVL